MASKGIKPQGVRVLLSIILTLVIAGGGAVFYFGLTMVQEYSVEVNNRLVDAEASGAQIQQLQSLRQQIAQNESLIAKADRVFATPANYQAQALVDLRAYANQTGLSIRSTDFDDPSTGTYSVTVRLNSPVSYPELIQFITLIEGNLPKMQVASIDLEQVQGGDATSVDVGDIKINISVR
jgi:hypothetical protein